MQAPEAERVGLALARLVADRLLAANAAIEVVDHDTLFRGGAPRRSARFGRMTISERLPMPGPRQPVERAGVIVTLPFCNGCLCRCCFGCGLGTASPARGR